MTGTQDGGVGRRLWGRPEIAYVLLAYAWSWAWWLPLAATGTVTRAGQGWPTHLPGLMGPALAAVVVTVVTGGRAGGRDLLERVVRFRVGWRWYAIIAGTLGLGGAAVAVQRLVGGAAPTVGEFSTYSGAAVMPWALLVGLVLVVNGYGEEIGWRGFLVQRWVGALGVVRTSLLVAAVWVPWHLPLFWVSESFRGFGAIGIVTWVVSITAGSVVLTWMYVGSGHSIAVVALWHTSFNMVTATAAGADAAAPAVSAAVIAAAVVLVRHPGIGPGPRPQASEGAQRTGRPESDPP